MDSFAWPHQSGSNNPFNISVSKERGNKSVRYRTQSNILFLRSGAFNLSQDAPIRKMLVRNARVDMKPGCIQRASALSASFRNSLYQSTLLPIATQTIHW
jgi:hypothetical protein